MLDPYHEKIGFSGGEIKLNTCFLIDFINKLHNFAEPLKFKCNLLFRCFFGLMTLALSIKCIFMFEHTLSKYEFTSAALLFNLSLLRTMLETLIVRSSATKPFCKLTMDQESGIIRRNPLPCPLPSTKKKNKESNT